MAIFRGVVSVSEDTVTLNANGIVVTLDGNAGDFAPFNNSFIAVSGTQEGSTIRGAAIAGEPESAATATDPSPNFEPVIAAIKSVKSNLAAVPGVIGIRPGFSTQGDIHAPAPVIVVVTDPAAEVTGLPPSVNGIRVEARPATAFDIAGVAPLSVWEVGEAAPEAGQAPPNIHYVPPPENEVSLVEMEVSNITCHIGPDSGWTTLKPYLEGTKKSLTVAMYEFYAQHILDTVTGLGESSDATLSMILQVDKNDLTCEETLRASWGDRLDFVPASVRGANRLFNNSYHTKVAVRDSRAIWLSSGNWSPNSQPLPKPGTDTTPYKNGNREWHVIIQDKQIAAMYEKFIRYDIEQAKMVQQEEAAPALPDLLVPESFFAEPEAAVQQDHLFGPAVFGQDEPVKVKPLMSPDNYAEGVLELINSAKKSLYLQFAYINQPSAAVFDQIIDAVAAKMKAGLDVKVIAGTNQKPESSDILIGARKWKRSMFRIQKTKLHNKGIIVDGKIAVVGSNNWSTDGTQYNRDTSLVFYSRPIAQYYNEVFMFDWNNLTRPVGAQQEMAPVIAPATGPTPAGMVRIPWQKWFND